MAANSPPTVYGEPLATVAGQASTEQRNEQNVISQQVVPLSRGRSRECDPGRSEVISETAAKADTAPIGIEYGPYGQQSGNQVDATVPSSYQKSPRRITRAKVQLKRRPSSLPLMDVGDMAGLTGTPAYGAADGQPSTPKHATVIDDGNARKPIR